MLKVIGTFFILVLTFSSCSKDSDETTAPSDQDTLAAGWTKVPIGKYDRMTDIEFKGNIGFGAAGSNIYKSTDGGKSWKVVHESIYYKINLSMGGTNNIILAGGNSNIILYSNNEGISFDTVSIDDKDINEVFFVNDNTAYIIGNALWKTNDAGKHWEQVYQFTRGTATVYRNIYFTDEQKGWAIALTTTGHPGLFRTMNGGKDWQVQDSGYSKYAMASISFAGENNGYINTLNSSIQKTTDDSTWTSIKYGNRTNILPDVFFLTPELGYFSDGKRIYKTTDGANTYSAEVSLADNSADAYILELCFTDPQHGWACGYLGAVLRYEK